MTARPPQLGPPQPIPLPRAAALLRPAALTVMAACVALPLTRLMTLFLPDLHSELLLGACLLAAVEAHAAHHQMRARHLTGLEALRFRLIAFGFYYLAIKGAHIALTGLPAELARGDWPRDLAGLAAVLLDLETVIALGLAIGTAITMDDVLSDLDRVGELPEREKQYVSPLDSLTTRFFMGGGAVLLLSGLARLGLVEVFNLERPPVTGLVVNVLVYFLLGFLLLGQVRLMLLTERWKAQGTRVPPELAGRWVWYSLAFLGLTALLAFALPTGYTTGVLTWLGYALSVVVGVLWLVLAVLYSICLLPVGWLMSLLLGRAPVDRAPLLEQPPPLFRGEAQPLPAWMDTLRTVVVWALILGMAVYIILAFLRDRPELVRALRELNALRRLRELWAALRHRVSGLAARARGSSAAAWLRERLRGRPGPAPWGYFRLGGATPGEQVRFYYLSLLRRASERGFGRQPPQTPHEYQPVLGRNLPENTAETQALTEAFEATRYSGHPVTAEQAAGARAAWGRVRAALAKKKREAP
jgi:hypothetical protein